MNASDYGPFASVIAIAAALAAVFSLLLLKSVGPVGQWIRQIGQQPSFIITAGARALAVALIAVTFVLINKTNYFAFAAAAVVFGVSTVVLIVWFDKLRKIHIYEVPMVTAAGAPANDKKGKPITNSLVIGTEDNMEASAKSALIAARKEHGGLSLTDFMSGYGATKVNNPTAIWSIPTLAAISNKLTLILMLIFLSAVMTLYLAASTIEVHQRPASATEVQQSDGPGTRSSLPSG